MASSNNYNSNSASNTSRQFDSMMVLSTKASPNPRQKIKLNTKKFDKENQSEYFATKSTSSKVPTPLGKGSCKQSPEGPMIKKS